MEGGTPRFLTLAEQFPQLLFSSFLSWIHGILLNPLQELWDIDNMFGRLLVNFYLDLLDCFARVGFPSYASQAIQSANYGFI